MSAVMMKCGHAANAKNDAGDPSCAICVGINPGAEEVNANPPSLEGRVARCSSCKAERPSANDLPFFEYRGAGSDAAKSCKCGLNKSAHPGGWTKCNIFVERGALDYDLYYCGCRGWD